MATMADWQREAEEQARKQSDTLKQSNQYLIDQLNQSKQNTLAQLQKQQDNAIYNLNTNKATINQTADANAKQLATQKLLALKSNQEAMNRAGLGSQGVIGSQVNQINNAYGNNLTSVLNQQTNDLRELEKQKQNALLTYDTNRLNLENEYGNNLANLQSQINDKALNQYNTVYNSYLNSKQQEYANQQAELKQQEAIRQYEQNLAFQKAQQEEAIRQYNENLALQKAKQDEAIRQFNAQMEYQKQQDAIANSQKWASLNSSSTKTSNNNNVNSSNNSNYDFSDTKLGNQQANSIKDIIGNTVNAVKKAANIISQSSKKYSSTYCPGFSTKSAESWAMKNIYNKGSLTSSYLETTLNDAIKKGIITKTDASEILESYGL